jgi:hypothetical protein
MFSSFKLKLECVFCRLGDVQKIAAARRDSQRSEMLCQEERCLTKIKDALPKMKHALPKMEDGPSRWKMPKTNL